MVGLGRPPVLARRRLLLTRLTAAQLTQLQRSRAATGTERPSPATLIARHVSYALKMLRLAGLVAFRKDGRMVCYRLSDEFPHRLLEQCLRELLTIAAPDGER